MSKSAIMEVHVQLNSGRKLRFNESNRDNAAELLHMIRPQKLFDDKYLLIGRKSSLSGISTHAISWILFKTPLTIDWPFPSPLERADLITKETFDRALDTELEDIRARMLSGRKDEPVHFYWQLHTADAGHFYFRIHGHTLVRMDKAQVPKMLKELPAFHATGSQGGGIVVNMQNVLTWAVHPGPTEFSPHTWYLNRMSEPSS